MALIEKLRENNSNDLVFIAIDTLERPEEIKQFYQEYVEYLREHGRTKATRLRPESAANFDIELGFIKSRVGYAIYNMWLDTLPQVTRSIKRRKEQTMLEYCKD